MRQQARGKPLCVSKPEVSHCVSATQRYKPFCACYLEDVDAESIKKLRASVPTVPLQLPETSSSLGAESSEGPEA